MEIRKTFLLHNVRQEVLGEFEAFLQLSQLIKFLEILLLRAARPPSLQHWIACNSELLRHFFYQLSIFKEVCERGDIERGAASGGGEASVLKSYEKALSGKLKRCEKLYLSTLSNELL